MKKLMRWWQLLIIVILTVTMMITMFLPAFSITNSKVEKFDDVRTEESDDDSEDESEDTDEDTTESDVATYTDKDGLLAEFADDFDFDIEKAITPFKIMTSSFALTDEGIARFEDSDSEDASEEADSEDADSEEVSDEEDADSEDASGEEDADSEDASDEEDEEDSDTLAMAMPKILLWMAYGLLFVILILNILAFVMKWDKTLPAVLDLGYGVLATGIFAYARFFLAKAFANHIFDDKLDKLNEGLDVDIYAKSIASFYSIAFLLAFVVGILFIIAGILCMLIGKPESMDAGEPDYYDDDYDDFAEEEIPNHYGNNFTGAGDAHIDASGITDAVGGHDNMTVAADQLYGADFGIQDESKRPVMPAAPKTVQKKKGVVKVIKGIAAGQGLMLPEDRKVVIGRSGKYANLVITDPQISNIHCSIRYNASNNTYIVKDNSTNGTYVRNTNYRMRNGESLTVSAGTILSLADGNNEVMLG